MAPFPATCVRASIACQPLLRLKIRVLFPARRQFSFKTVLVGRIIRSTNNRHLSFDLDSFTRTLIIKQE
ncbi:hypothetical protein EGJ48_19660 [Pantoea dispersa]|nr:hypothetical protein EGJ48_19660 [Pantoea dispersa]